MTLTHPLLTVQVSLQNDNFPLTSGEAFQRSASLSTLPKSNRPDSSMQSDPGGLARNRRHRFGKTETPKIDDPSLPGQSLLGPNEPIHPGSPLLWRFAGLPVPVARTPSARIPPCKPFTYATPKRATRLGSSPKVSSTLPQRGSRYRSRTGAAPYLLRIRFRPAGIKYIPNPTVQSSLPVSSEIVNHPRASQSGRWNPSMVSSLILLLYSRLPPTEYDTVINL